MRDFTRFKRDEKETRLDIFCYNLDKKEGEELFEILKNLGFTFGYVESDSMLAFLTGEYSKVKRVFKKLKKYYGFSWTGDPAIIGITEKELEFFLKGGEKDSGSRSKVEIKRKEFFFRTS